MNRIVLMLSGAAVATLILVAGLAFYFKQRPAAALTQRPEHGISYLLQLEPSNASGGTNELAALKRTLLERCRRLGTRLFWEPVSESSAWVALDAGNPDELERRKAALFDRGWLEFRLLHVSSDALLQSGEVPAGYEVVTHEIPQPQSASRVEKLVVKREAEPGLAGNIIKQAAVVRGALNEPQILFTLQPDAARAFATVTSENLGRRLAIILDGRLYSAPTIQSPIASGKGQITGSFTVLEALNIASAMDAPLPVTVKVMETRRF